MVLKAKLIMLVNFVQRKSAPKNAISVMKIKDEYFSVQLEIILFIYGDEMSQTQSIYNLLHSMQKLTKYG